MCTPGTSTDRFAVARDCGADVALVDLEDSVAPQHKATARTLAERYFQLADMAGSAIPTGAVNSARSTDPETRPLPGGCPLNCPRRLAHPGSSHEPLHAARHHWSDVGDPHPGVSLVAAIDRDEVRGERLDLASVAQPAAVDPANAGDQRREVLHGVGGLAVVA